MTTALMCEACGTELRSKAKFCDKCGAPIGSRGPGAEYKQVTVLFADVVRSMEMAAALGPERLREIMAQLVDRATAVVRRFDGTLDKFTGDGIMAVFGAPVALEDHALRACRAGLIIQHEIAGLAVEVAQRDGIDLQLRVGLSSGQVIAGDIGTAAMSYTAVGEQVGMAQRMESVAPPGAVMLSPNTARLVEGRALLAEPQAVHVKGAAAPVLARLLLSVNVGHRLTGAVDSQMVGRQREVAALTEVLNGTIDGQTSIVALVGTAGMGKTRLAAETVRRAEELGMEVRFSFCESHTTDIPFGAVARLLRGVFQIDGLDAAAARARVRAQLPNADAQDILLLDDLLSIADRDIKLPNIDAHARRRRLTALITRAQQARTRPALIVVEDVHWIDEISESMLVDLLPTGARSQSMVLLTYRPEYSGALRQVKDARVIVLEPLNASETSQLVGELLGSDPSVAHIARVIGARASGNPFFAEEIVRDLAERAVLTGKPGRYYFASDIGLVRVPATLQATLAARIDRLTPPAKQTLSAAAVIGFRFPWNLLKALHADPAVDELVSAELIDEAGSGPNAEYAFRHPLIRTVAYESQLTSDRADLHRRLATAVEAQLADAADQNAALIAEHYEAAGDWHAAYTWHMRAADWATNRDITAARLSWERAIRIADRLPPEDPRPLVMRITPRAMLCGNAYRLHSYSAADRFEELTELCIAAGDKTSLYVAMVGVVMDHVQKGRVREGSQLARQTADLIQTIGANPASSHDDQWGAGREALRQSQRVVDLADTDRSGHQLTAGSTLALALAKRARVRYWLGRSGWREDVDGSLAIARDTGPLCYAQTVSNVYLPAIPAGVLRADDRAVSQIEDALRIAQQSADSLAVDLARVTLGVALVHHRAHTERDRGRQLLATLGEAVLHREDIVCEMPIADVCLARAATDRGQGGAIPLARSTLDHLIRAGQLASWGAVAAGLLVESLLERNRDDDLIEAEAVIERLAAAPADDGLAVRDIWLMRLEAMLARARGQSSRYLRNRGRYRDTAKTLGFEGHIDWAETLS